PSWSPMPAVVGCLTLTVILSVGLREREASYVRQKTQAASVALATQIRLELDAQTNRFERLARHRADASDEALANWEFDARAQREESRGAGCASVAYVDGATHRTTWYDPIEGNEGATGFEHDSVPVRRDAIAAASRMPFNSVISGSTTIHVPSLDAQRKGTVIYAPVLRNGTPVGYIAAEFAYDALFGAICKRQRIGSEYAVAITLNGGEPIFAAEADDATRNDDLTVDLPYTISDRRIRISLTPSNAALAEGRRYLPELALTAGFGITLLLGLSVHLARSARAGQRAAELSNKRLFGENEERRRIEARLKVSDERLRLALDSTQIGIFEWSVAAGHVYYSPGLWAMLGYDHARMPSTVEAWQSLIHPDDLALYRRRTESQLSGIASFIEPEYRVRARSGDWRWVYTRSKSVATGAD